MSCWMGDSLAKSIVYIVLIQSYFFNMYDTLSYDTDFIRYTMQCFLCDIIVYNSFGNKWLLSAIYEHYIFVCSTMQSVVLG